ncbi:hypothetical protein Srot_2807 [Segniliparus rotundus DSM 44985]|uniref:Uncharacterized protein n=1 Tax=Segniliparus rotundus (strain ATCC BAA-972 / CDC 1076 / CIP 108378 / DSM 44985 / JCM 13578) TaxID=640132 RepID=D6ZD52_SEGRD|nr:hypothetical protein [Segniliparus rotundus]ADG99239.1 hypothetical protein Srot_2807 [Segniliparus rotundus DSM 44985]
MSLWFPLPVDVYEELGFAGVPAAAQNLFVRMVMATARHDGDRVLPKAAMRYVREGRESGSEKAHIRRLIGAGFVIETEDGKGWAFPTMDEAFSVFEAAQSRRDKARERRRRLRAAEAGEPQDGPDVRALDKTETRPDGDKTSHSRLGGGGPGEEPARSSNSQHNQRDAPESADEHRGIGFHPQAREDASREPQSIGAVISRFAPSKGGSEVAVPLPRDWQPEGDWAIMRRLYPDANLHAGLRAFHHKHDGRDDIRHSLHDWGKTWCQSVMDEMDRLGVEPAMSLEEALSG